MKKIRLAITTGCLAVLPWALGEELLVGVGYGEQVGLGEYSQNNTVVDVLYDFYSIDQGDFQLSFGAGLSWLLNDFDHKEVLLGCIYPSFRYYLTESEFFTTYAFVTTGFSYMTEPSFGHQILGGYFSFNDFIGVGTYVGRERVWSMNVCWRHISNGGVFKPNRGIDIPLCVLIGRRF